MKVDNSFDRYINASDDPNYRRYAYSVSELSGEVLDVGCGDGFGCYLMTKNKNITSIFGIDKQKEAIQRAKHNLKNTKVRLITGEAEDLPYHNNIFDSVHCGQTLEHVTDDNKTVAEIYRVTRKRAVFSIPIYGGISEQHIREYSNKTACELISKYFTIISTKLFTGKYNRLVIIAEK